MNKDKIKNAIMGFAIGDAFGVPYEFIPRNIIEVSPDPVGNGSHHQPAGTWSDDTSMVLATMDALTEKGLDPYKVADNFLQWFNYGKFTPHGKVFDAGARTIRALSYYDLRGQMLCDNDIYSNGNGALMRVLPLAFLNCDDKLIDEITAITHPHEISLKCSRIYVKFIRYIYKNWTARKLDLIKYVKNLNAAEGNILDMNKIGNLNWNDEDLYCDIKSDGYVVHSLEAALCVFFHTYGYEESIMTAVSLGSDTDTIAAITGGLTGLYYELDAVSDSWKDIANIELINKIIDNFVKTLSNNSTLCN